MHRTIVLLAVMICIVNCGKNSLDRAKAMKLLQGRNFGSVQGFFPSTPRLLVLISATEGYQALMQLAEANVITCDSTEDPTCRPGPNGEGLSGGGTKGFTYNVGSFTLAEIVGILQPSPTTAIAQARLNFQPSPLYKKYKSQLDQLEETVKNNPMVFGGGMRVRSQQTTSRVEEIQFVLFDDGWRRQ